MAKKIYVGNMNYRTTEESLKNLFSEYGEVGKVNIISDKVSGRAKGFGFVEMVHDEDAAKAIEELNGKEFEGRQLKVNEAHDRPRRDMSRERDF
ncbi:MAG TPA: RNA-binding protein [Spirochaetia bacterium]|nr:RNA-binding protein [Spirochaetia bacterium]